VSRKGHAQDRETLSQAATWRGHTEVIADLRELPEAL
jgi:hypothetical protein